MPRLKVPPPPATATVTSRQDLAYIVRFMRLRAGLTAEEAALSIGVAKATLLRLERGDAGLQFDNVLLILDGLGVNLHALPRSHSAQAQLSWPNG